MFIFIPVFSMPAAFLSIGTILRFLEEFVKCSGKKLCQKRGGSRIPPVLSIT
jgi:hypothetical protein